MDHTVRNGFDRLERLLQAQRNMAAEPARLKRRLDRFAELLREHHSPVVAGLLPGVGEAQVRERLAPFGLTPPPDLITWFGWHDGYRQPLGKPWRGEIAMDLHATSLEDACTHYVEKFLRYDMEFQPPGAEEWFPIMMTGSAEVAMMYCGEDLVSLGTVATLSELGTFRADTYFASTLAEIVEWWIDAVESGLWVCADGFSPTYDFDERQTLPLRLLQSGRF